ncbi:PAS domain S-box protein [Halalkalicoccus tibetensis]|uniref:histidine kinase n=1 Tax=Halalkalicoccus tibetensis TaxID=175632 RepID=A0ABD5V8L0_9EURY
MGDDVGSPEGAPMEAPDTGTFYRTLVRNASEGLLTIDAESRIVHANPAIEEILGYSPEELIGSSKMKIIPERLRPVHAEALESYLASNERHIEWEGIELPALHKEVHEVPTLISIREHRLDGQRLFTGVIRDISEQKQRRTQLQRERERLDEFASILTHDIRNPLQSAQGYTEIAREEDDSEELRQVADALARIEELVEDVLMLSRNGADIGEREYISLRQHVLDAWEEVGTEDASLEIVEGLGSIEADSSRVYALLSNVFRNSVEHGSTCSRDPPNPGDSVEHGSTSSRPKADDSVEHAGSSVAVRVGRLPDQSGFYIEDDGPGIPESVGKFAFDQGYSTREDGTGYGLTIVARIASAHGWETSVTEGTEGGARFEFAGVTMTDSLE